MKGDDRHERAKKDTEVDTGVGEGHGASSSTEMSTGSGIKRNIDMDHGDAMTDVETTGKSCGVGASEGRGDRNGRGVDGRRLGLRVGGGRVGGPRLREG